MREVTEQELFEKLPVHKAVATLAIPTIISQIVSIIYNLADTFFIGQLGNPYMVAATTLVYPWFTLLTALGNLFGIGGSSLVSRLLGAKREDEVKYVSSFCFYGGIAVTFVFSLLSLCFHVPLLRFLGASEENMVFARTYLFWVVVLGGVPTMLSMTLAHFLRSEGHAKLASTGIMLGGILNMVLDPIFIYGLHMGFTGAAVATALSNLVSMLFFLLRFRKFEQYDTVILGFPNWWGDLPMPVYSFLEEYDFGAKTIIPFVTHGGSGFSGTLNTISELQPGAHVSDNTLSLSRDDVADGEEEVREWAEGLGLNTESVEPESSGETVGTTEADPKNQQTLYLWENGNAPATTEYTENNGNYADDPDFCPYLVTFPVPEGKKAKGAVLICAGGAFQYRSDNMEGTPVAQELSKQGYQSFVVNYRLRPYTQEEGALDLARAVRFVRKYADVYGIDEKDIAVMGFSAGGILAGEMLLNFDGTVNGTALDSDYKTDELDAVSADAAAAGMIYSFYGRLSVASKDVGKFAESDLPPTYFCYGTRDPFVSEFEECMEALKEAGVSVESDVLEGRPHGYGYTEGWMENYAEWLTGIFQNNAKGP